MLDCCCRHLIGPHIAEPYIETEPAHRVCHQEPGPVSHAADVLDDDITAVGHDVMAIQQEKAVSFFCQCQGFVRTVDVAAGGLPVFAALGERHRCRYRLRTPPDKALRRFHQLGQSERMACAPGGQDAIVAVRHVRQLLRTIRQHDRAADMCRQPFLNCVTGLHNGHWPTTPSTMYRSMGWMLLCPSSVFTVYR